MPLFLIPLVDILLVILRSLMFWKSAAFLAVIISASTDAGKSVIIWFMSFIMGLVMGLISGLVPSLPSTVPGLMMQLPTAALQLLKITRFPECLMITSQAMIAKLMIRMIPFYK